MEHVDAHAAPGSSRLGLPASRHVILYGPPAAGKLAVATAMASVFDVRVVDNHSSIDPALKLFAFSDPGFLPLVQEIRVALTRAAAQAQVDIVSTLVYAKGVDDELVAAIEHATTQEGGVVYFVQLLPAEERLFDRVRAPSRWRTNKIKTERQLRYFLDRYDVSSCIHDDDMRIDNSDVTPVEIAEHIGRRVGFKRLRSLAAGADRDVGRSPGLGEKG